MSARAISGKYVSEFEFRYNARKVSDAQRPVLIVQARKESASPTSSQLERARIERALFRGRQWRPPDGTMSGGRQGDRTPLQAGSRDRQRHHAPPNRNGREGAPLNRGPFPLD